MIKKIQIIAKTGGIIFADEPNKWYNPTDIIKPIALSFKKHDEVEIIINKEGKIESIKKVESNVPTKTVDWDAKDRRIVRQNALSHATSIATHNEEKAEVSTVLTIAAELEAWVYRD